MKIIKVSTDKAFAKNGTDDKLKLMFQQKI